jgi:hypothetical protein
MEKVDSVPVGKKVLNSSIVMNVKRTVEGTVERYKARLVADGSRQKYGIDYKESFAPVVKATSVRLFAALANQLNLQIDHLDVETAFLYGDLDVETYIRPPAGFDKLEKCNLGEIWKLLKSLYGLVEASRIWNKLLDEILGKFGLNRLHSDWCIYIYRDGDKTLLIAVYVDDMLIAHNCPGLVARLKSHLSDHFRLKDLGPVFKFLGIEFNHDRNTGIIELSQRHYIRELVKKFIPKHNRPFSTPVATGTIFSPDDSPQSDAEIATMKDVPYRELIGSLNYIVSTTRGDCAFAISNLARFCLIRADGIGIKRFESSLIFETQRIFAFDTHVVTMALIPWLDGRTPIGLEIIVTVALPQVIYSNFVGDHCLGNPKNRPSSRRP